MKARTWMLVGWLMAFAAVAQAHEQMPAKPAAAIKIAGQPKFDLRGLTAAEGSHLECDNAAQDPPAGNNRARTSKPVKDAPAPRKPRRAGCDSFHCVARAGGPAAETILARTLA